MHEILRGNACYLSYTETKAGQLRLNLNVAVCLGLMSWLKTVRISACGRLPRDCTSVDGLSHTAQMTYCIILHPCLHHLPECISAGEKVFSFMTQFFPQLMLQWFDLLRRTCPALWNRIAPVNWDLFGAERRKCFQHQPHNTSQR